MKQGKITDFKLRAGYPTFRTMQNILQQGTGQETPENPDSSLSPGLEFQMDYQPVWKTLTIHPSDIPLLTRPDKNESLHYLGLLVQSASGNLSSGSESARIRHLFLEKMKERISSVSFIENENVVPCTTSQIYDDVLLSQKGKMLLELYQEGYPVPDFCILTSRTYQQDMKARESYLHAAISNLEKMTGEKMGDPDDALIFAMRCATPQYIPGLMPTYLNVGVTKMCLRSLEKKYGLAVTNKIYLNNLQTIFKILMPDPEVHRSRKEALDHETEDIESRISLLFRKIARIDEQILYDAHYQARIFMNVTHGFFSRNQDLIYTFQRGQAIFPSLILQKMVWTVRNQDSYPGVLYSRHPRTGLGMQIESVREIFGEEIMTGSVHAEQREYFNREEIMEDFPAIYQYTPVLPKLEVKLKSPVTIEFAVESFDGASFFAILQLNMSELTGRSTLLTAIDLYQKKIISKKRVIQLIHPYHLRQIFSERIDDESLKSLTFFGYGVSVLPRSAVSTRIYFSMSKALEAKKRGEKVCLCKENFIPSETIFMAELDVIMSMNPLAIHVVTACLGYGIPAFINLKNHSMTLENEAIVNSAGIRISEGDWITVSSKLHSIFIGKANYKPARFQKYLEGHKLEMEPKEERVFINMARAYKAYQEILNTLKSEETMTLSDLVKLIRNDYDHYPQKARDFVNGWFDVHGEYYYIEILKSGLGSHMDQHKIYSLLTTNRKIIFFRNIIRICRKAKISGFSAGAFMLGRFLCQAHPTAFWEAFKPNDVVFLLNEYILFEKYMQVLSEFGERHLSRTKNKILTEDLENITLSSMDPEIFIPLKFHIKDWDAIESQVEPEFDKETRNLIQLLKQPFGSLFNYQASWSFGKLKEICQAENREIPEPTSI